jgi:transcriptional regulator with XRE-family HTH domain
MCYRLVKCLDVQFGNNAKSFKVSMDLIRFGEALRRARESQKLTQDEVVERLGRKDVTAISEYENGKRRLAAYEVPDYAAALGVPISYFFEEILPEDEIELAVVEWFRTLPGPDAKRRVFVAMKEMAPFIIGGAETVYKEPRPVERTLNDQRAAFGKRRKK